LPVPAQKVGCLILVSAQTVAGAARRAEGAGLYTRVSSHEQKCGLDGQVARLSAWADKAGLPVVRVEAEAGSGMSGLRAKVRRLLSDLAVAVVVSGHRDRLGRVNAALVEAALAAHSRLVVLGDRDVTDGLVGDMVEVLTWLCAQLYGRRQARNRVLQALGCAADSEVVVYCRVSSPGQKPDLKSQVASMEQFAWAGALLCRGGCARSAAG
jgi:putative resolvase